MNMETTAKSTPKGLSKKSKLGQKAMQDASLALVSFTACGSHKAESHRKLRERTLSRRRAKMFRSVQAVLASRIPQRHGVELTDDVIVWDGRGNRIPRTIMPIDRIDQLPQFKKS